MEMDLYAYIDSEAVEKVVLFFAVDLVPVYRSRMEKSTRIYLGTLGRLRSTPANLAMGKIRKLEMEWWVYSMLILQWLFFTYL